ncbi:MAG TPA: TonB family protein [Pyrinomonadaceae bacterium]|nr:TonB family protein [Pyrinomonadaceae bacterium]
MFERQIGFDPEGNKQKGRSPYFGFSVSLVSLLFATFLVVGIFADDFSLPADGLEMTSMLAPAATEPAVAEPQKATPAAPRSSSQSVPTRTALVARVDEAQFVPDKIGVERSNVPSRPDGPVELGKVNDNGPRSSGTGRPDGVSDGNEQSFGPKNPPASKPDEAEPDIVPPPVVDRRPKFLGIITSKATYLPKPQYPDLAERMGISGSVSVQVVIDEQGRVVSATASSGNAIFRETAVRAARQAKFTPTVLSNVPIKVTGIIVYHFTR